MRAAIARRSRSSGTLVAARVRAREGATTTSEPTIATSSVTKTCYPPGPVNPSHALLLIATASLPGVGCGRRATAADCQLIVDKSVELQSREQSDTDPAAIQERAKRIRAALDDELKACQSRRVTDRTMTCVKDATSTKELDACLR